MIIKMKLSVQWWHKVTETLPKHTVEFLFLIASAEPEGYRYVFGSLLDTAKISGSEVKSDEKPPNDW